MIKQKYTADDIKKIYEKSLHKEPVGVEVEKQNSLIGNVLQPFKNIQANYVVGDLGETERKAWSAYRAKQDAESLKAAQKATAETEKYAMANRNVGQGNIVTKDFAQYLPQMKNQIISGLGGAGERAVLGAGAGAGMALLAGQAGPQVLTPEEIVTVPAGAVAGGVMGGKAGYMEGVARYSYNQMAGAAYKNLLDLGVPNDIAIKVSGDEALILSLIESAGAGVDIATVGIGKLFSKAPKDAVVKTAKNRLVSALKAYGINILSEAMEEGSQEIVSIQSEKRALKKAGMPERDVTPEEDIARILEAARGGAAVATVSGGLNVAGNIATNAIYNNQIKNSLPTQEQQTKGKVKIEDIIKQNKEVTQEQHDGRVLPTVNTNKQVDQSIEQVSNVAQKANRGVTDNIQQRQGQIVENVADMDIKISPKYRNKFIRSVFDALGVSKYSNKANINSLLDMLVEEIARGNNIDAQSAEILFNTLMDEGVTVDSEFYNLYKDLKNEIKNTRLYVGDDVRAEYGRGEYNNFKKAHFGKLNLTSDRNNMSVDQYYQELSGRHPELFPENIIVQQDQLGRIADVVNSIVKNEDKLSSLAQNDKEYRQFARAEFDKAINNLKEEVKKETVRKLPTKSQQTILNDAAMRIQEAKRVIDADDDGVADVLTSSKQKKLPVKKSVANAWDAFKRKFVDSGSTVAKVGRIVNDAVLYILYNNARQSRQAAEYMISEAQTDVMGNKVGDSLKDIFDPIRKKGNDYYKKFSEYMFHLHNIDRMAQGKPVFGESVTAEMSQVKVNEFEYSNPEFIKYAAKVHEYNQNLMQYRIDTGLVSVEQANVMNEMYPNYVPTYRKNAVSTGARGGSGRVEITQGIKKATGSSKDLLPLHEQMARQTMQVVQAGKRNLFGNRLLSDTLLNRDSLSEYIQAVTTEKADIDIDEMTTTDLRNSFTIYNNGEKTTMKLNTGLYEGVKSMASEGREYTSIERGAKAVNSMFKKLVTAYNPMFTIKNVIRDLQDAGIYTKDLKLFTKNFPIAYKEIITNGKKWQQYQALGGFGSSIFDYERGYKQEIRDTGAKKVTGFVKDNTYERIEALNFWTEQAPRFAEFLATLEKGDGSYENLMEAMYNSADVTVNFGRSGTWGKVLNSTFVPFFNPAVQGTDKLIRHFTGTRGVKNWTKLVIRVAALGIAPSLVNSLIYDDDDDFDKIHNRDKDINFLLKIGDDQWVKIPKGRVLSLFGNAAQRTLRTIKDEEDAWAGFISTSADNVLPMNPIENSIYAPIQAVKSNITWYGTPIEGQGLQAFKPGERFDTRTDSFSIWLGKRLNYSPKKINYLLDAYTGVIGDFALPLMSKKAETNAFKKQFVLDSTLSNKVSTTFYRKIDDLTYEKNSIEEDNVYDVVYRFMNKQRTAVSDLNREIKAIENSDLSNNEQKTKVKEITAIKNGIQLNALDALEEYQKAAEKNFKKFDNDVDNAYLYTNKDMFGAEYALKTYNKNIYQKYLDSGQSAEKYFEEYFTELFAKREAKAAKEASTEVKIKLPTIKTIGSNTKLPTIKNK